jgi:2-polyprenyl-3-methyl-5-hydroxy-6-metoxy-1,4-benzoquinol methylase
MDATVETPRACEVCGSHGFSFRFTKADHRFVRCDDCGLERIDPQPTDETLAAIYGKHYYDAWGLHRDEELVRKLKRGTFGYVLARLSPPRSGAKLLDCGAATGFLLEVAQEQGWEPYGVELSDFGATEIARKFGGDRVFRELSKVTLADGSCSAITMCDYLEHVRDPRAVLEIASRLLEPGGAVVITMPDTDSFSRRVLRTGWTHYKIEHLYYFGHANLTRLLEQCGFEDVSFRPLRKRLNIKYIREQFEVYPHPVLSRAARTLGRVLPEVVQSRTMPFLTGELLATARRRR